MGNVIAVADHTSLKQYRQIATRKVPPTRGLVRVTEGLGCDNEGS